MKEKEGYTNHHRIAKKVQDIDKSSISGIPHYER